MTTQHFTTVYFFKNSIGRIFTQSYRPTDGYQGQKASDSYALMQGMFIDNISHEISVGGATCHLNTASHSGINTKNGISVEIIAKKQLIWDYSKPLGQRETVLNKTSDFDSIFQLYLKQPK